MGILSARRGVWATHDFPLIGCVGQAISNLELRGEDADGAGRKRWLSELQPPDASPFALSFKNRLDYTQSGHLPHEG